MKTKQGELTMNLENKNPILTIKGFGTMRYQQIVSEINRRVFGKTQKEFAELKRVDLDNKLPSEKRIIGQMLITVAEYELEQKLNKWRKEERKDRISKQKQEEQKQKEKKHTNEMLEYAEDIDQQANSQGRKSSFDIREKLNPVPFTEEVK